MAADYRIATFTWTAATFHRCGRKPSLLTLLINVVRTEPQYRTWAPRASWRRWNRFTVSQFEGQKNLVNVSIIIFISFLLLNRAEYLNHKDKFWTSIYATTVITCNSQSGCSPHLKQMKGFQHDDSQWLGAGLTYDLDGQRCVVMDYLNDDDVITHELSDAKCALEDDFQYFCEFDCTVGKGSWLWLS